MQKDDVLLRMEGICKSFPGVKALDDAQLTVRPGTCLLYTSDAADEL